MWKMKKSWAKHISGSSWEYSFSYLHGQETNQNTQEVKNEHFLILIRTRQNNVQIFSKSCLPQSDEWTNRYRIHFLRWSTTQLLKCSVTHQWVSVSVIPERGKQIAAYLGQLGVEDVQEVFLDTVLSHLILVSGGQAVHGLQALDGHWTQHNTFQYWTTSITMITAGQQAF